MKIKTWDGNNINDGTNYDSVIIENAYGLAKIGIKLAKRHGAWPLIGGIERPGKQVFIHIIINRTDVYSRQRQLNQWFDPDDEIPKQLVVEDDGGGNDRYVEGICERLSLIGKSGFEWVATIRIHDDVLWRETSAAADSWSITATGQTKNITNNGQADAYPLLKIKPTSNKTVGNTHKRFIPVRWRNSNSAENYPIDITNGNLDTQIGSTNFALANGDDLRVWVDGIEVSRWLNGINTASTSVWVNLDFKAKQSGTLDGAIGTGNTIITVNEDISNFPSSGILRVDSEIITYTGKSNQAKNFTGCVRGSKGTSAATHTDDAVIWWVQHEVWILYGDSGASTPSIDDDYEPMFKLSTSTNLSWDFDEFYEDDKPNRAGAWDKVNIFGMGFFYGGNQGASTDPYVEAGLKSAQDILEWKFSSPCRINNANFQNGESKSTIASGFDGTIYSSKGLEYTIPVPATDDTWTNWSRNEVIVNADWVSMRLGPPWISRYTSRLECADITITLNSTFTPTVSIGGEITNYDLSCRITNNTTGESVDLTFSMQVDEELEFDSDAKTIIYLDDNTNQFQALALVDGPRRDWLAIQVGVNQLQFDDTGTGNVTIAFEWDERYYQ